MFKLKLSIEKKRIFEEINGKKLACGFISRRVQKVI